MSILDEVQKTVQAKEDMRQAIIRCGVDCPADVSLDDYPEYIRRIYEKITHTVTFNANGGEPEPEPQIVEDGLPATKPETDPVKEGSEFKWWSLDTSLPDVPTPEEGYHIVTFNRRNGEPSFYVQVKDGETLPTIINPVKKNARFTGWTENEVVSVKFSLEDYPDEWVSVDLPDGATINEPQPTPYKGGRQFSWEEQE